MFLQINFTFMKSLREGDAMTRIVQLGLAAFLLTSLGCADSEKPVTSPSLENSGGSLAADDSMAADATENSEHATGASKPAESNVVADDDTDEFVPLSLGSPSKTGADDSANTKQPVDSEQQISEVMEALKPLQVMLGKWSGKTRLDFDGFKAVDQHEWIWDLQSNPDQPALKISSDASPYLKDAWLTWDRQQSVFLLAATDKAGVTREFSGTYTDPVHEIVGPDEKLHKVFRLELTQTPESQTSVDGPHFQLAFAQQENNRYLLEVGRRRGKAAFRRYDTVSTQREGTSFAVSDSDYGDKTCIISQGLGTISVSYEGKSYWVCCSGCKAAFESDPATWIARDIKRRETM